MRTVFLGTTPFAAALLERLAGGPHRPARVLTRPDRRRGRGRQLAAPPVAETARELGIPLEQPERVNDPETLRRIERAEPGAVVVCAFGALIAEPLLSAYPMLNVHPSLLPRWRGAAPIERAIMAGDTETGVSIMRLAAGLDSGPVGLAAAEPIGPSDDYDSLARRLRELGGNLLTRVLDAWDRGEPPRFAEQDEARATYAEKIGPTDRLLDPARPAAELERAVRALHPHIGARVALADGTLLGVARAALAHGDDAPGEPSGPVGAPSGWGGAPTEQGATPGGRGGTPGGPDATPSEQGVTVRDGRLLLRCATGLLELLEVQPPGGRAMDASSYLRGHRSDRA